MDIELDSKLIVSPPEGWRVSVSADADEAAFSETRRRGDSIILTLIPPDVADLLVSQWRFSVQPGVAAADKILSCGEYEWRGGRSGVLSRVQHLDAATGRPDGVVGCDLIFELNDRKILFQTISYCGQSIEAHLEVLTSIRSANGSAKAPG